ncbi:alpha/beta fold hydrolase [Domibacillus robiginosus]|uniref:alpha/beta fold hydrolase n=1 Tax=Domibacillus robiginosus TaxID=1071054 RepID=UPI00067CC129
MDTYEWTKRPIGVNGINLYTEMAGPENGELVLLLHGFPECSYGWKKQADALVEQGYRVVVPNMRGYSKSSKPEPLEAYTLDVIAKDIISLIQSFGFEKALVVGHDWGGIVGWFLASVHPDFVQKLVILNVPHPAVFAKTAPFYPLQWLKSAYIFFFQLPFLPEWLLKRNEYSLLEKLMKATAQPGTFDEKDMRVYKEAWAKKGSVTAMLNWYRAMRQQALFEIPTPGPAVPVRMLWGRRDAALSLILAKKSVEQCGNGQLVLIDEATHWLHHEYPEIVSAWISRFLKEEASQS